MPFNGASPNVYTRTDATYVGATVFQQEAANGVDIEAVNLDYEAQDMADALSLCLLRDGSQLVSADIPFNNHKLTGVATATARTDAIPTGQMQDGTPNWAGTFGGTANALTCTLAPAITAYTANLSIWGIAASAVTATANLNSNSVGTINIKKLMAAGKVALVGGEWNTGDLLFFKSDGTDLILINKVEWQQGADIASATTTDLGAATGEYVRVTGTTTITGLGTIAAGVTRIVTFTGALLLTYNASSLIVPGAASITTAAGDSMIAVSLGAGNWRVVIYQTAAGASVTTINQGLHTIDLEGRAFTPRTTNGPGTYSVEVGTAKVMVVGLAFDQTTSELAQARFVMPQSWNAGTITCRFRWTAASGTGTVIWAVQAMALRDNVAIDTAFGTAITVTDTLQTVNYEHVSPTTAAITIGNSPAKADTIYLQVYRDISDTLNADAVLLSVELFSTINAPTDA